METSVRVPVIVRREHRPEWGPIKHCIYLIVYTKNRITPKGALYVGRFKDVLNFSTFCLGNPYVGSGKILLDLGLKIKRKCTFKNLPYNLQWIDHIECWYCTEQEYKSSESLAIRHFAETYGISPLVLQHSEPNSFTSLFVRPDGLLLNCHDNCAQQMCTDSTLDSRSENGRKNVSKMNEANKANGHYDSLELKTILSENASKMNEANKANGFYESQKFQDTAGRNALKMVQANKANGLYDSPEFRQLRSQSISKKLVNGRIPSKSSAFFSRSILYVIPAGVVSCAHKATEITGIYVSASSLSNSLKRNHGDTWYKGIHFKYASLLTEEEKVSACILE